MKKTLIFILISAVVLLCACNKEILNYNKEDILLQVCITTDSIGGKYENTYTYELHTDNTLTTVVSRFAFLDKETKITNYGKDVYKVSTVKIKDKKFEELKSLIEAVENSERVELFGSDDLSTVEIMTDKIYDCLLQKRRGTNPTSPYLNLTRTINKYSHIKLPAIIKSEWEI